MKTIWKFPLKTVDRQHIKLPKGADILCLQLQYDEPVIWALVDNEEAVEEVLIETFGTGHELPTDMGVERKYIGTYQQAEGRLVFHVFQRM